MRTGPALAALAATVLVAAGCSGRDHETVVVVGSKSFTESVILGEALRSLVADAGITARHQRSLGGTRLVFNAVASGEIDAYVEYTGTLTHEIFAAAPPADERALRDALARRRARTGWRPASRWR